jgi:hypothetical protein
MDHAATAASQVRVRGPRVQEVAPHVHVHHPVPVRQGRSQQARLNPDPGVVNQHIESPELLDGQVHRARYSSRIASVSDHEPALADIAEHPLRAQAQLLIPPGHHDPRALSQEPAGNGKADAGGAPGDQHLLTLQPPRAAGHVHLMQLLSVTEAARPRELPKTPLCRHTCGRQSAGNRSGVLVGADTWEHACWLVC